MCVIDWSASDFQGGRGQYIMQLYVAGSSNEATESLIGSLALAAQGRTFAVD